jgi:ATP-binding cassette subfamily G (WHITE) protein 2
LGGACRTQVVISTVNVFVAERALLLRERSKGMYHVGAYMLAKTLADMLNTVLLPTLVFANSVYWAAGLKRQLDAWAIFIVTFVLVIMVR